MSRVRSALQSLIVFAFLLFPSVTLAAAWPQAPGATQVIVSYEPGSASKAFDPSGHATLPLSEWNQNALTVFVDHGVTKNFTLTTKLNFNDYKTDLTRFSGLGSVELGGRWTLHKGDDFVFALGASVEGAGKGRRDDFDIAIKQGTDTDLRAYFGKGFKLFGKDAFVNVEAARHLRQFNPSQYRVDATLGVRPSTQWLVMAQTFIGQTDKQAGSQGKWTNIQLSLVRSFGPKQATNLQLAVRQTIAGQNVPAVHALVLSLWKTF